MCPKKMWMVGVIAAGIFHSACLILPDERLLMRDATKIVELDNGIYSSVLWRSDHSVILLPYRNESDTFHFVELETNTGLQKPLESLDRGLGNHLRALTLSLGITWLPSGEFVREASLHFPPVCSLSLEGNWLLATNTTEDWRDATIPKFCIALNVDGNTQVRWPSGFDGGSIWMDNGRWLERTYRYRKHDFLLSTIIIHNVNNEHADVTVPIPAKLQSFTPKGISANDRLFLVNWSSSRHSNKRLRIQVANLQITDPKLSFNTSTIKLPMAASVQKISISTDGTRIAWLLEYRSSSPHPPKTTGFFPRLRVDDRPIQALWVSRLNGSGMVEVGHRCSDHEPPLDKDALPDKEIVDVQWVPGDKKISFVCRGVLYTIPVAK